MDEDYQQAIIDILDASVPLEKRLRVMYVIKNNGKTYENALILKEAATKTSSVLLEHELYYNLGQFQLTGKPCKNADGTIEEADDIVRFLMDIITSTSPRHDSISRHEALEALGAIFANPNKGLKKSTEEKEGCQTLRQEVLAFLDDLAKNERIIAVRQSAELARDRLLHADATQENYNKKVAAIKKNWVEMQRNSNEESSVAENTFEYKWHCPSQIHAHMSVDPSPAFDEEENDSILAGYKKFQNLKQTRKRVNELAKILRNEVPHSPVVEDGHPTEEPSSTTPSSSLPLIAGNYSLFDRYRAMFSLRNIESPEAIEILSESLVSDKSCALFRHEIAFVLGQIEKASCEKALIACLNNPKEAGMVRHEAAIAIGGIAQPTGLESLQANVNDRDTIVAESCVAGIEMHKYWSRFNSGAS